MEPMVWSCFSSVIDALSQGLALKWINAESFADDADGQRQEQDLPAGGLSAGQDSRSSPAQGGVQKHSSGRRVGLTAGTQTWSQYSFSTPPRQGPSITALDTPAEPALPVSAELAGGGRLRGALGGRASRKQGEGHSLHCPWQLSQARTCFLDGKPPPRLATRLRRTTGLASGAGCGGKTASSLNSPKEEAFWP
ncbi:hypothetical protein CB1_000335018 [Camelus ferus]|nr:hypothetical protein CB1_000335018 [Camelus ferus]